jgi:N-acetylglucosamine-6-phosphate deacetylase
MGIADRTGSIAVGKQADLVLLNANLELEATIVGGNVVFERAAGRE